MNRRAFLATTAGLTLGLPATALADSYPEEYVEADCEETVWRHLGGGEYTEIPKAWEEFHEHARGVRDEIQEEYGDESWYVSIGMDFSLEEDVCGRPRSVVEVTASDVDAARPELEAERDGVEIWVEEGEPAFNQADGPSNGDSRGEEGEPDFNQADSPANEDSSILPAALLGALASVGGLGYLASRRKRAE